MCFYLPFMSISQLDPSQPDEGGNGLVDTLSQIFAKPEKTERSELLKRLGELGHSTDELANSILAILVGFTVELSISLTNTVNIYLGSEQETQIRALSLGASTSKTQLGQLDSLVQNAFRLDPAFQGVYRVATKDAVIGGLPVKKGERVFVNIANANLNDTFSANSQSATTDYLNGDVTRKCLGESLTVKVVGEVVRAVYGFNNVRRGPGQSGTLTRFQDDSQPSLRYSYLDANQFAAPWPTSLVVKYDL